MHDRKLLGDSELDDAELSGKALTGPESKAKTMRANFWTVLGFCATGLMCSLYVPSSYLHLEQTGVLLIQAPLG
jgi:hypothetical protein